MNSDQPTQTYAWSFAKYDRFDGLCGQAAALSVANMLVGARLGDATFMALGVTGLAVVVAAWVSDVNRLRVSVEGGTITIQDGVRVRVDAPVRALTWARVGDAEPVDEPILRRLHVQLRSRGVFTFTFSASAAPRVAEMVEQLLRQAEGSSGT